MISSTITSKGQTTLPKPVRLALGVTAGDQVRYVVYGAEVRLLPVLPIGRLFGALKHDGPPVSLEDMERGIAEGACEEHVAVALRADSPSRETLDTQPNAAGEAVTE